MWACGERVHKKGFLVVWISLDYSVTKLTQVSLSFFFFRPVWLFERDSAFSNIVYNVKVVTKIDDEDILMASHFYSIVISLFKVSHMGISSVCYQRTK